MAAKLLGLLGVLFHLVPQGLGDSVSCYACGLPTIDPERDSEGSYGTDPGEGKKMYNHSCDQMDLGLAGEYKYAGQELAPRNWVDFVQRSEILVENGVEVTTCKPRNTTGSAADAPASCDPVPVYRTWTEMVKKPPKKYDMSMWVRKCPNGVRSCFKALGNWEGQKPIFRGCAEAKYPHGTYCKRELQSVTVTKGQPKEDIEIYLCYCSDEKCNVDISGTVRNVSGCLVPFLLLLGSFLK